MKCHSVNSCCQILLPKSLPKLLPKEPTLIMHALAGIFPLSEYHNSSALSQLIMHAPCRESDCSTKGCKGNRLERTPEGPHKLKLWWPHHKNERRWGKRAITFGLPQELSMILEKYLEARTLLARPECPYLLVTPRDGIRITISRFSQIWARILARWEAGAYFPPQVSKRPWLPVNVCISFAACCAAAGGPAWPHPSIHRHWLLLPFCSV